MAPAKQNQSPCPFVFAESPGAHESRRPAGIDEFAPANRGTDPRAEHSMSPLAIALSEPAAIVDTDGLHEALGAPVGYRGLFASNHGRNLDPEGSAH